MGWIVCIQFISGFLKLYYDLAISYGKSFITRAGFQLIKTVKEHVKPLIIFFIQKYILYEIVPF
jgi:hypothetical protein